jgi:uncharacterized membrane protein
MEERDKPNQEQKELWSNDPKYWKWGIFYFNPEDKRIFPPKRNKYAGWTVNFANFYSVLAMLILIVIVFVFIGILKPWLNKL